MDGVREVVSLEEGETGRQPTDWGCHFNRRLLEDNGGMRREDITTTYHIYHGSHGYHGEVHALRQRHGRCDALRCCCCRSCAHHSRSSVCVLLLLPAVVVLFASAVVVDRVVGQPEKTTVKNGITATSTATAQDSNGMANIETLGIWPRCNSKCYRPGSKGWR